MNHDNNDLMDSMTDEFEMKPITAGLGFHKKPVSLKDHIAKSSLQQAKLRTGLPVEPPKEMLEEPPARSAKAIISELHEALKTPQKGQDSIRLTDVLPKDKKEIRAANAEVEIPHRPTPSPIEKINFQIPDATLKDTTGTRRGASDNLTAPLTPVSVSFAAMFLDAAIVLSLSLIFLAALISVTGVDLFSVVASAGSEFATQLSLIVLYFSVYEMYLIVARSFFGKTVGEWTFDLQMGTDEQIARGYYPVLVLWRAIFIVLTGLITMPILSLITRRDLSRSFTGLQLYRRNY